MKKLLLTLSVFLLAFTLVACNDTKPNPDPNPDPTTDVDTPLPAEFVNILEGETIYLTTIGQNADFETIYNVLLLIGVQENKIVKENLLVASDARLTEGSHVILVPGASSKGMGAAGTNQTQEQNRALAFSTRAQNGELNVYMVHSGGAQRRGVESDPLITASSTHAALMLVVNSGNADNFFTNLNTTHGSPLYLYSAAANLTIPFRQLFNKPVN